MIKILSVYNNDQEEKINDNPQSSDEVLINYSLYELDIHIDITKENYDDFLIEENIIENKTNLNIFLESNKFSQNLIDSIKQMKLKETSVYKLLSEDLCFIQDNENKENKAFYIKIRLNGFNKKIKSRFEMNLIEKLDFSKAKKEEGIKLFKEKRFLEAYVAFDTASGYILSEKNLDQQGKELLTSLLLNVSNCSNNLKNYDITIAKCSYIIQFLSKHPKAYYYRGIALSNLINENNLKLANEDLNNLKLLVPNSDEGVIYLEGLIKDKSQQYEKSQKSLFKSFFKTSVYDELPMSNKKKIPEAINEHNPQVYLKIEVGTFVENDKTGESTYEKYQETIEIELFADIVPKTAENFLLLCTSKKYLNSIFHRSVKDFMIQGGDYENYNGTGGKSIYGNYFEDENFIYNHTDPFLLSMANSGPNKNGSQFFITLKPCEWLDGKHVVFGRVIKGHSFIEKLNAIETGDEDRPIRAIKIIDCGKIGLNN